MTPTLHSDSTEMKHPHKEITHIDKTKTPTLQPGGAVMKHPHKAYLITHIDEPEHTLDPRINYVPTTEEIIEQKDYILRLKEAVSYGPTEEIIEQKDYILRLKEAVSTLFGYVEKCHLHTRRTYTKAGLTFHDDLVGFRQDEIVPSRVVTCVHNLSGFDRPLHFRHNDGNLFEDFQLTIPDRQILAFGEELITEYEHGIPPSPEAAEYVSLMTRFYSEEE